MKKKVETGIIKPSSPFAVIDVGTTAIRMVIADLDEKGYVHPLEFLQQSVSLGHDTFTKNSIQKNTISECVRTLKNFRRVIGEYGVTNEDRIRAVATTAVREAQNRDAFTDRIYIATGIRIEVLDVMAVARLAFLSARSFFGHDEIWQKGQVILCEIGGGSTEVLILQKGNIVSSHSYKLGTLRLREMIETFNAPVARQQTLMESEIRRTIDQIVHAIPPSSMRNLVAVGSDVRFAKMQCDPEWNPEEFGALSLSRFDAVTKDVLLLSVNECVKKYHLSFPDAETLAPGLLFYSLLAKRLSVKNILASDISMRHGALIDMMKNETTDEDFRKQVIRSGWEIAKKYNTDEPHAAHVMKLCDVLFTSLQEEHRLGQWYRMLLSMSAILHDIGMFISPQSHHKHSMYLIRHSELFGLSQKDVECISLMARYHRKSTPRYSHPEYVALDKNERLVVAKLAAILRVADALDRSHGQRISTISCRREKDSFVISVPSVEDLTLEQLGVENKGDMFEEVYGLSVIVEKNDSH